MQEYISWGDILVIRFFDEENKLSYITELETDILPKQSEEIVINDKCYFVTTVTKIYDNNDSYVDISVYAI